MAKRYSEEQMSRANSVNLVDYLQRRGETIKRAGSEYKWIYRDGSGEHDSVTIKANGSKWFDHKRQQGGDAVGFLQEFMDLSFKESVEELLNGEQPGRMASRRVLESANGLIADGSADQPESQSAPLRNHPLLASPAIPEDKKDFVIHEKSNNMHRLYAYLTNSRFLNSDIVTHFAKTGALFEDAKHHNAVFLGLDENGVPRAGQKKSTRTFGESFRATIAGSETQYGFHHKGTGNKLFVFEAPIDLMSYLTIYPDNWQKESYIALDGLSPKAMLHFLEKNPQIDTVNICVDADEAGIEAHDKFKDTLVELGYTPVSINRIAPPQKDWNECLKAEHGIAPISAENHPKIDAYREISARLCDFYTNGEQDYSKQFIGRFAKEGMHCALEPLEREYQKCRQSVDLDRTAKIVSGNINERLMRIANLSLMAMTEIQTTDSKPFLGKKRIYTTAAGDLFNTYKPYTDKGKLKNHCSDMEQALAALKSAVKMNQEKEIIAALLKNFADNCIRTKIYIETRYEQDLAMQQSLVKDCPAGNELSAPTQEDSQQTQDESAAEFQMTQIM